jgi:hypothetical protein
VKRFKFILVLVFVGFSTGGVFAQNWYDSYAPGIDGSRVLINAGIGFGLLAPGYDLGIPPISASADFKLPVAVPITVGPLVALASQTYSWNLNTGASIYGYKFTYTHFAIGARGMYHFNFLKNLDTYAGLVLGYVISNGKADYTGEWGNSVKTDPTNLSYFLWGINIGARYFFTNNIGAYLELGYSGLQVVNLGLSLKF